MKTIQKSCIKNACSPPIVQFQFELKQSVLVLIHIVGIYFAHKRSKYYIPYITVNFSNLK